MKPAVAGTIRPRRPRLDFPSIRATTSFGSSTHSSVRPRQNSPGWITNPSSGVATTSSVSPFGGPSLRSITAARWLWNTRNVSPKRRSIDAGWTSSGFHGRMTIAPSSTRRRIVPSDRTESGTDGNATGNAHRLGSGSESADRRMLARPSDRGNGSDAGRRQHARAAHRAAAAWRAWTAGARMRTPGLRRAAVVARQFLLRSLSHRPPDDQARGHDGQLQEDEEVEHRPAHRRGDYPGADRAQAVKCAKAQATRRRPSRAAAPTRAR